MSRWLIGATLVALGSPAFADDPPAPPDPAPQPTAPQPDPASQPEPSGVPPPSTTTTTTTTTTDELPRRVYSASAPPDMSDQAIGAEVGLAIGGRVTPGGVRVAGHYLYQLAGDDWFDGIASFTFGGGGAACFRDRMDAFICEHGITQGDAFEVQASVRHFFGSAGGDGKFFPYLRGGVGIGYARFGADSVSGLIIPLHVVGGLRASVSPTVAITFELELVGGFGVFNHTLGLEPQLSTDMIGGVEFKL
jgi:hypothetical protein